jgi:uncharacterized membrane protein
MASDLKLLLAGESWTTTATHIKGWDQVQSATFHRGADHFVAAMRKAGIAIDYMPSHVAAADFPLDPEALDAYDAIILSDIGSNTLLLPPQVWIESKTAPNRLKLIRDYVARGGGLVMIGGYYSFQGLNGGARYHRTPIEEILPVSMHPFDDRVEIPEGFTAVVPKAARRHPVLKDVPAGPWPVLLGVNEVKAKRGATVLASVPADQGGHPLLVAGTHGKGRSVAWTSDIGPHWLPGAFSDWDGFRPLWSNLLRWVARNDAGR